MSNEKSKKRTEVASAWIKLINKQFQKKGLTINELMDIHLRITGTLLYTVSEYSDIPLDQVVNSFQSAICDILLHIEKAEIKNKNNC